MKMIDHKGATLVGNGDGTFTTTTGESSSNGPVTGVCANRYPTAMGNVNGQPVPIAPASARKCFVVAEAAAP